MENYEAKRILPIEVNEGSADSVREAVSQEIKDNQSNLPFETKEEYIKYLIESKEIRKDEKKYNDGFIHLKGHLVINNRVKAGLNWSDVETDSASVETQMIKKYAYLPRTRNGVKTELETTKLDEFLYHNSCEAMVTNGKYQVKGIFRIPNSKKLPDLSSLKADVVLCYNSEKLHLNQLPTAEKGFYGLDSANIIAQGLNISKTAKAKGLGKNICRDLKAREPNMLQKFIGALPLIKTANPSN